MPRAVLFDVDGCLYKARPLQVKMAIELAKYYGPRPFRWHEPVALVRFRRMREKIAEHGDYGSPLEQEQYRLAAGKYGVSSNELKTLVERWIIDAPLPFMAACKRKGVDELLSWLAEKRIATGVFSDYPVEKKISVMGLLFDAKVVATDLDVDRLKPDPKGLIVLMQKLGVTPGECVFIGDRYERDGLCAQAAGVTYWQIGDFDDPTLGRFRDFGSVLAWLVHRFRQGCE